MNWEYLYLTPSGHVVYDSGDLVNKHWPRFKSEEEAEKFLADNDERANIVGIMKGKTRPNNI